MDEIEKTVSEKIIILEFIRKHYSTFRAKWPYERVEALAQSIDDELNS